MQFYCKHSAYFVLICFALMFPGRGSAEMRPVLSMTLRGTSLPRQCAFPGDFKYDKQPVSEVLRSCFSIRPIGPAGTQSVLVGSGVPDHPVSLGQLERVCEFNWRFIVDSKPAWARHPTKIRENGPIGVALNGVLLFPPKVHG